MYYRIFNVCTDANACDWNRGYTDAVRESGRKKHLATPGNQTCVSGMLAMLYQLSYIPAFTVSDVASEVHVWEGLLLYKCKLHLTFIERRWELCCKKASGCPVLSESAIHNGGRWVQALICFLWLICNSHFCFLSDSSRHTVIVSSFSFCAGFAFFVVVLFGFLFFLCVWALFDILSNNLLMGKSIFRGLLSKETIYHVHVEFWKVSVKVLILNHGHLHTSSYSQNRFECHIYVE